MHRSRPLDAPALLENGFQPESVAEAYQIVTALLDQRLPDRAAEALERARELQRENPTTDALLIARLQLANFRTALARGDSATAVPAVNHLARISGILAASELELVTHAARSDVLLHPEIRAAIVEVLESIIPGPPQVTVPAQVVNVHGPADPFEVMDDDDLPWIDFEADGAEADEHGASGDEASSGERGTPLHVKGGGGLLTWGADPRTENVEAVEVRDASLLSAWPATSPSVESMRDAFVAQGRETAIHDPRRAFEMAYTLFLLDNFDEAAALFAQVTHGDHRDAALEGFVRCKVATGNPRAALAALGDAKSHFEGDNLPSALRYWAGRAAEAAGELALARTAYRGLPGADFPDARHRLRGLVG